MNVGWGLLGFIIVIAIIAAAAIALDIWLDIAARQSRYRDRSARDDKGSGRAGFLSRLRPHAWIALFCAAAGTAALFAIADNTVRDVEAEQSQLD
jgi:hypothetical protein